MKNRHAKFTLLTLAAALGILLNGCSVLPPPPAPDNVYLLDVGVLPTDSGMAARRDVVLAISPPRARAGYDTARMIWVSQAHRLDVYARNRWADTPARMLTPLLVQALAHSGAFGAVVPSSSGVTAGVRLDTELIRLHQDFTVKPSMVRFTLGAQLIDIATQRVIATAEFDETEPSESEDAYGGVRAANRALARLLARVAAFSAESAAMAKPVLSNPEMRLNARR